MKLKDSLWIGIAAGLIAPFLGILIFYMINYQAENMTEFISKTVEGKILSPLLSLCAVVNLAVFYLFLHYEKYYSARGVILSTMFYGLIIVVLKFVL